MLAANLTTSSLPEIIVSGTGQTAVFDNNFQIHAYLDKSGELYAVKSGYGNPDRLALRDRNLTIYEMTKHNRHISHLFDRGSFAIAFIFLLASLFSFLWIYFSQRNHIVFASVVKLVPLPLFILDKRGRLLAASNKGLQLYNADLKIKKHDFADLMPSQWQEQISSAISILHNKESVGFEEEIICETKNRQFRVQGIAIKNKTGILTNKLLFLTDISLHVNSQQTLEWAAMAQRLAHEIKNPLSILKLTLERLQISFEEHNPEHGPEYREQVDSMYEEVDRLRKATDGFMKLAKAEQPRFSSYPVKAVLDEVEQKYSGQLPKGIDFKIEEREQLPCINLDLDQMVIVFSNLIENAVRAMEGKGKLLLTAAVHQKINTGGSGQPTDFVVFELSDTGIGIPEKDIERVFDPFYSKGKEGTGLGMAICKRIIKEHHGTISLQSKINVGTTVYIEIPVRFKEIDHDKK